jgi:NADPH2:quinone reductase
MKAAFIERPGPPESIRYGEVAMPVIRHDRQVLVKVTAVTVNPIDTYIRSGAYPIALPRPFIIGRDLVGVVDAVGAGVTRFAPGQRVWSNNQGYGGRQGTFAEFVSVDEELLYPLPDGVNEQEAVASVHSALTACLGVIREAGLKAGETLFINGGSGNVGSAVLQVARHLGARVIVTAGSTEKLRRCLELGADRAVNYKTEDVAAAIRDFAPQGVDVYWDTTREPDFERAVPLLQHRGRLIVMAGLNAHPPFPVGPFYTKDCSMHGFAITNATTEELCKCAGQINGLLAAGALKVKLDRVMPLAQASAAHRLFEEHQAELSGKIVLIP